MFVNWAGTVQQINRRNFVSRVLSSDKVVEERAWRVCRVSYSMDILWARVAALRPRDRYMHKTEEITAHSQRYMERPVHNAALML